MWRPSTRRTAAGAYGVWLQWLADQGALADDDPSSRLSVQLLKKFTKDQVDKGIKLTTVADRLNRLTAVVSALSPNCDLEHARPIVRRVKSAARKETSPKGFIVHARTMYDLGFNLMDAGRAFGAHTPDGALHFLDGLIVAVLTACPLRIENLSNLRLDHDVIRDVSRWRLLVAGNNTKTSKPEIRSIPEDLTSSLDEYVSVARPQLMSRRQHDVGEHDAFFIGPSGSPLRDQMMRKRIKARTGKAFGTPVLPHSFRKLAITTLVMERPEHAASAPMLLNHTGAKVSEDHYIIGQQILALEHYHKSLKQAERQPDQNCDSHDRQVRRERA